MLANAVGVCVIPTRNNILIFCNVFPSERTVLNSGWEREKCMTTVGGKSEGQKSGAMERARETNKTKGE